MLLTQDWTTAEIETLCSLAETLQALDRQGRVPALFPQELFWALFFDQSTRTKSSWAGAAARLGGQAVIVDGSSTQVSHGETSVETGAMLGMNAHALGIRHDLILGEGNRFMRDAKQGIDDYLARRATSASCPSSTSSATSTTRPSRWPTCCGSGSGSRTAWPAGRSR